MSTIFENLFYSKLGQGALSAVGVKPPIELPRYNGEQPWVSHTIGLAHTASEGLAHVLNGCHINHELFHEDKTYNGLLFDATELASSDDLQTLYAFFSHASKAINKTGRVLIVAKNPRNCDDIMQASIMQSLNGFTRSLAKELGRKAVYVNLLYVDGEITETASNPINFLLSHRASYVTGQPLWLNNATVPSINWEQPLAGKTAVVTGAAQGIGAAIARVLHQDGAHIIGLDMEGAKKSLESTMADVNGTVVCGDVTTEQVIDDLILAANKNPIDILVHNAGVTRDKTIARMPQHFWDLTININLKAPISITAGLEQKNALSEHARIVCISSISGIAGNVGQTNYSTSKSGIAGYVSAQAERWQGTHKTINAIAPGFIETQMTEQIPFMTREMGRRMNSLSQGGKPEDVAQAVALFAHPGSAALNGQLLRVCGQSLLGA